MSTKKPDFNKEDILGIECRNVIFIPPTRDNTDDYHLVKEIIHLKCGRKVPHKRIIKNFKRKFWITKEGYRRHHTQKKEWEDISKLQEFETTQSQLVQNAAKALNMFGFQGSHKKLARNPYLYGSDILSTSVIKQEVYRDRWPDLVTPSSIAGSDVESDMVEGHKRIIMQTITFKNKVFTSVAKSFLRNIPGTDAQKIALCKEAMIKYLGKDEPVLAKDGTQELDEAGNPKFSNLLKDRNIEWEMEIVEHDGIVVLNVLKKAHEWSPDFLAFWNMDFDVKKMNESLKFHNISLADAWSDPAIARDYRFFEYKPGQDQKVTASGKKTPIPVQARWHTVFAPAGFYVIDGMCSYKQVRTGKPEERSYGLDAILNKHLKRGKLDFEEAEGLAKADWHIFMQKNYPIEYIIYNVFDCIGMELLDEKIKDLSVSVPSGAAMSDLSKFNSQPRRVVDKLHYFALKRGKVIGTTSDEMADAFDSMTISLKDWIVMLPAHLVADNGLKLIKEYPNICSNVRLHVGDLDVSASYPNGESVFNISKETTKKELISIEGVTEGVRRMQGINLSGGASNAVEFCTGMFHMPQMTQWIEAYRRKDQLAQVAIELREWIDDGAGAAESVDATLTLEEREADEAKA